MKPKTKKKAEVLGGDLVPPMPHGPGTQARLAAEAEIDHKAAASKSRVRANEAMEKAISAFEDAAIETMRFEFAAGLRLANYAQATRIKFLEFKAGVQS